MSESLLRAASSAAGLPAGPLQSVFDSLNTVHWGILPLIKIIAIVIFSLFLWRFFLHIRKKFLQKISVMKQSGRISDSGHHFLMTFLPVGMSFLKFSVILFACVASLSAVGVSTSIFSSVFFLIAFGLAMGTKDMFSDILRGFFTLAEGKVALGNFVTINGSSGVVQSLTMRQIELRYNDGSIEIFPFSKVGTIRNHSVSYHVATPTFQLESSANILLFEQLATETLQSMHQDEIFQPFFHENTPQNLTAVITKVRNEGIDAYINILIHQDPQKIFECGFYKMLLPKLQKEKMLR